MIPRLMNTIAKHDNRNTFYIMEVNMEQSEMHVHFRVYIRLN